MYVLSYYAKRNKSRKKNYESYILPKRVNNCTIVYQDG